MPTLEEIKKARMKKLESLKIMGLLAYPSKTKRSHKIGQVLSGSSFKKLVSSKKEVVLAGRIKSIRTHGKLTFLDIEDDSGKIQAILKENRLGEKGYQFFLGHFDIGDFAEFKGSLFETKTKEKTFLLKYLFSKGPEIFRSRR